MYVARDGSLADLTAEKLTTAQWIWRCEQIKVLPRTRAVYATEMARRAAADQAGGSSSTSASSASSAAATSSSAPSSSASSLPTAASAVPPVTAFDLVNNPFGPRNPSWSYCLRCSAVVKGAGRGNCHAQTNWCEGGSHQLPGFEARRGDHAPTRDWRLDGVTYRAPPFPQPAGIFYRGRVVLARAEDLYYRVALRLATQNELQALPVPDQHFWAFIQSLPALATIDPARSWRQRDLAAHNRAFDLVHSK